MPRWPHFGNRDRIRTGALFARRVPAWAALAASCVWMAAGCDSGSFVPPPPEELRETSEASLPSAPDGLAPATGSARSVELVLGRHIPEDSELIKASARVQAGLDTVKLKVEVLGENPDGTPAGSAGGSQ